MVKLKVIELLESLEDSIESGETNEDSIVISTYNNHVGYIVDYIESDDGLEFITKYGSNARVHLTVRELIESLEDSIESGEIYENSIVVSTYNNHLGYIVDYIETEDGLDFITKYGA